MTFTEVGPMKKYETSLRRKQIHQGVVTSIETHTPFGISMQCAIIDLGDNIKGMIHEDQFDKQQFRSLVGFIDHTVDFMVLDPKKRGGDTDDIQVFDREKGIVLLSRVQALEELQEEFWDTAEEDHICTGTVSGFEEERIYLLVKGVVCILPISDYEYDWTPSGRNLLPLGTQVTVKVKKIDREKKRVTVTRKELLEDPWNRVRERFKQGDFHRGVITSVVENTGIFIKLCPGVESLAWFPNRVPSHGELVGKTVSVKIGKVDLEARKIKSKIVHFPHEIMG
ncbi:30S ribosomal protein S1 [Paenibacillus xylanilyticus]|uniref:30S ribosomal protein S1 n=1 Tax=Paenibacillus xylanilyticus TaxID=248903 RepID=UPI0039A3F47F